MLDVLIGGDKLADNLIAPTNSPARSYSASSPARSSPARAAHAGLFDRAASAHSTPAPTGLCSPSRQPPFAASAPASTAAWRPRCLASVRRRTASARASLPRLRLPSHGLAAFSSAPTAARRLHCRIPSLPLRLPQQSLRTPPSPTAATVRATALLSSTHQQGLQHSRCSA